MEFKEKTNMKVYVVMWEQRVGADSTINQLGSQAFTTKEGANKHIEEKGLRFENGRYSDYGRGLYAWVEELTLIDAIETKDGMSFIKLKE